jgi:single-strand DNA-binding protein
MLLLHPGEGPGNAGGAMRETYVAVAGIVATDPQVRTLDDGRQVMSFRVASTSRRFDGQTRAWVDGHTLWVRVTCWRELADNASRCVRKRDRVLAWGRLHTEQWKGADGVVRSDLSLDAESLGHDLTFGVSAFTRKRRAVDQRTLTDVPTIDQDTGEIISVPPGAPAPDAESDDASRVAVGAALPEADDEFDELDDDLADADSVEAVDGVDGVEDPEDVEGDSERVLVGSA